MSAKTKLSEARPVVRMTTEQDAYDDGRDAWVKARYPDGLTPALFKQLTLESADVDGRVFPPYVDPFLRFSLLMRMLMDGLIDRENTGYHTPLGPFRITPAGRAALSHTDTRSETPASSSSSRGVE